VAAVALLVTLAAALPISPNGLGVGEAAFVLLYTQIGVAPEQALAAALLRRVVVTLVALVGAVPWLASRDRPVAVGPLASASLTPAPAPAARGRLLGQLLADLPPGARPLGAYVAGCVCFSLGVTCLTAADLGIDPLHAMALAIVDAVGLPHVQVGLVVSAVTLAMLAGWAAWLRRLPPLSVFVTMALTAYLVDMWRLLAADAWLAGQVPYSALTLLGLALDAYGSALIIMRRRHPGRRPRGAGPRRVARLELCGRQNGGRGRLRRRGLAPGRPAGRRDPRVPAAGRPVHGADDVGQRPLPGTTQPRPRSRPLAPPAGAAGLRRGERLQGWPARRTRALRPPVAV
jgi:hypothetical protein